MADMIIGAGLGQAVSGVVGGLFDKSNTDSTNSLNDKINKRNLKFQETQNNIMRSREDNAHQREAADLEAAGINKLMAGMNGAQASGGLGAPTAIPMQRNNVGEIIQNTGQGMAENVERASRIKKAEAEINNINSITEFNNASMEERVAIINAQIGRINFENKETEAKILATMQGIDESEQNIALKMAQEKLVLAEGNTEIKNAVKVTATIELLKAQIEQADANTKKIWQDTITSEASAEKIYAEIEKITTSTALENIDLEFLTSDKVLGQMGQAGNILTTVIKGLKMLKGD